MPKTFTRLIGVRNASNNASAGDGRTGAGYATLKPKGLGSDVNAQTSWPYTTRTQIEDDVINDDDERDENSRSAIHKKNKTPLAVDRLQQLNYKTGAFVNGSTRGLTGIMSGVDPVDVLESFIKETLRRSKPPKELNKPIGLGGINPTTSSNDITTRTRPGMTLGSKQGWFSAPPPKESDPSTSERFLDIEHMVASEEDEPIRHANMLKKRSQNKGVRQETHFVMLTAYIKMLAE